jgi:cytochrome c oxidase assembly protein subunit 15
MTSGNEAMSSNSHFLFDYSDSFKVSGLSSFVWLRRYTKFLVAVTLFLIFAGSLVTSTGAGLSVPDWPNTYGTFMFLFPLKDMVGGIFYEHSHRLIASTVGLMTVILALWVARRETRSWVKKLAGFALATVVLQGLLGGLTVLFFLPAPVSSGHAVLGQTFFIVTIVMAYSQSRERWQRVRLVNEVHDKTLARLAVVTAILIYVQLILGAVMRHTESGLAVPDFPTMAGAYWPTFDAQMLGWINSWRYDFDLPAVTWSQVVIHLTHRLVAILVSVSVLTLGFRILVRHHARREILLLGLAMMVILVLQFSLGALTILTGKQFVVTSVHVTMGAFLLGLSILMVLRALPVSLQKKE